MNRIGPFQFSRGPEQQGYVSTLYIFETQKFLGFGKYNTGKAKNAKRARRTGFSFVFFVIHAPWMG